MTFALDLSESKLKEFCTTVGITLDAKQQKEFGDTLKTAAKEERDSSIIGAPLSRLWGNFVGCFFLEPGKWGQFASTSALSNPRVDEFLRLSLARRSVVPLNSFCSTNETPNYTSSLVEQGVNRSIARIQPAVAATLVNEDLPKTSQISERDYNKYFLASSIVSGLSALLAVAISIVAIAATIRR